MESSGERYIYLDNIRNILVYNVVFYHAMVMFAYPFMFWWPFVDKISSSRIFESLLLVFDLYMMPHLIFISVLFIIPSLKRRSTAGYLKKRTLRLIAPMIVYLFCAGEIVPHVFLKRVESINPSYLDSFLKFWSDFFSDFGIIFLFDQDSFQNSFNLHHTWFLSFLFIATLVIVFLSKLKKPSGTKSEIIESRKKIIVKILIISMGLALLYISGIIIIAITGINPGGMMRVAGLISFRLDQGLLLLLFVMFGLYVYQREWLARGDIGSWKFWGILSLVFLLTVGLLLYYQYMPVFEDVTLVIAHNVLTDDRKPIPVFSQSFRNTIPLYYITALWACISLLMFFLSFFKRFFNRPNRITSFCSKHSIFVYVLHFTPVILLQYALKDVTMPPIVKILLITIIVIPACLWLSHRLVYPYPKIAIVFFVLLKLAALYAGFDFYYYALLGLTFISFAGALVEGGRYFIMAKKTDHEMSEVG